MTENEAREKICHRTLGMTIATNPIRPSNCIASACMAWRTDTPQNQFLVTFDGKPEETWLWDPTNRPHYAGRVQVRPNISKAGFCGLAGQDRVQ